MPSLPLSVCLFLSPDRIKLAHCSHPDHTTHTTRNRAVRMTDNKAAQKRHGNVVVVVVVEEEEKDGEEGIE